MRLGSFINLVVCGSLLAGCSTIQTSMRSGSSSAAGGEGVEYFLPTGQFVLQIWEDQGQLEVGLGGPIFVADYNFRMRTNLLSGQLSDNDFTIGVGEDGLLTSFSGNSDGQAQQIVETGVKSIFGIQAGTSPIGEPFFSRLFSLDEKDAVVSEAHKAIEKRRSAVCARAASDVNASKQCDAITRAVGSEPPSDFITLSIEDKVSRKGHHGGGLAPIASVSFSDDAQSNPTCPQNALCYHPVVPIRLTLSLSNGQSKTSVYLIPDRTVVSYLRAPGGIFAKQEYNYTFIRGIPMTYKRLSRSEVTGFVGLPLTIAKSIISAPVSLLTSREATLEAQTSYLNALTANISANNRAVIDCNNRPDLCQGSVFRTLRVQSGPKPKVTTTNDDPTG